MISSLKIKLNLLVDIPQHAGNLTPGEHSVKCGTKVKKLHSCTVPSNKEARHIMTLPLKRHPEENDKWLYHSNDIHKNDKCSTYKIGNTHCSSTYHFK